ncbi:hypothetical protein [Halococcus sp. PRR34]|uniref:hypothetical protein n=1 Tax=Halococcus sp. PRR34 TaxID=3020830 RepID=UPI00235E5396|nr:hypothetical protein [Halococcus sp. PRR34]
MDEVTDGMEHSERELARIRKRVLEAEKEKLNLRLPRGINNDIERIIREEIN